MYFLISKIFYLTYRFTFIIYDSLFQTLTIFNLLILFASNSHQYFTIYMQPNTVHHPKAKLKNTQKPSRP